MPSRLFFNHPLVQVMFVAEGKCLKPAGQRGAEDQGAETLH